VTERNSTIGSRIGRNSRSPEYHYGSQLSQLFRWSIIQHQMVSDLRVITVGNSTSLLNQNSGQIQPFGLNQDFDKILP
jgi:hypothetical protein